MLPTPEDAVVLQCISESLLPTALKKQPSKNAFFSRSHSAPNVEFTFGADYIWFKRWREFSRKRFSLTSVHDYVVTTDISTFYDNIKYSYLRNMISEIGGLSEVVLDILFEVVDRISWRPDYLPSMQAGLPQVQFDAPRLLAHVYLYEIDDFLKKNTGGCFVRWVDDITFAVDDPQQGKRLLRDIDALLQLRGIRLNSGKTAVLSQVEARTFFHAFTNEFLDRITKDIDAAKKAKRSTASISARLRKSFDAFRSKRRGGHEDKVIKRYIGTFASIGDAHALQFCNRSFHRNPEYRDTILRYFMKIGPYPSSLKMLTEYLTSDDALDDASICQVARCLTLWEISPRSTAFKDLEKLAVRLSRKRYLQRSYYYLVASLWLLAKYGTQKSLRDVLRDTEDLWSKSEFLSRQVAACAAKFRVRRDFDWISVLVKKHGFQGAGSVLSSLEDLHTYQNAVPQHILLYCTNGNQISTYSVQRFLISFRVATSRYLTAKARIEFVDRILKYVTDPHYKRVLERLR